MLANLHLQDFRCFEALSVSLEPGFNFFIGGNGEGKTSILEGACVLLRLQSQRSSTLAPLIRFGVKWFGISGRANAHELQFRYSTLRRKVTLDTADQRTSEDYLRIARVVSFANTDIELARGTSEPRRRYLDFIGSQIDPIYRPSLRAYERALRCRNALLKAAHASTREIAAYDAPLIEHGTKLAQMRLDLVARLAPVASEAHKAISQGCESLGIRLVPGSGSEFATELARSRREETRLRQTIVGPHRDDIELLIDGKPASQFASEGQQRTLALALKIAQAQIFATDDAMPPVLLIDDIFGELDTNRRRALLRCLSVDSQKLVTATTMPAGGEISSAVFQLHERRLERTR